MVLGVLSIVAGFFGLAAIAVAGSFKLEHERKLRRIAENKAAFESTRADYAEQQLRESIRQDPDLGSVRR